MYHIQCMNWKYHFWVQINLELKIDILLCNNKIQIIDGLNWDIKIYQYSRLSIQKLYLYHKQLIKIGRPIYVFHLLKVKLWDMIESNSHI